MSARDFYAELGIDIPNRAGPWIDVRCFNPAHEHDRNPSCGVNLEHGGFRCQACGESGSAYDAAVLLGRSPRDTATLCKRHGLGKWDHRGEGGATPSANRATVQLPDLTLEAYAEAKRLPADFLRDLGISDYKDNRWPHKVLRIPYRDAEGNEKSARIRKELHKRPDGSDYRFLWTKGSKAIPYGLERLRGCTVDGPPGTPSPHLTLVEGESDAQTLWQHGYPALGLPGAALWKNEWAEHLNGVEQIYVVIEPDAGGDAVMGWLAKSNIRDRAWLVQLDGYKDPSGLHLTDPDRFRERWEGAIDAANPWRELASRFEDAERREAGEKCAELAKVPRILDLLAEDAARAGVTGETRTVKLVYLAATSRLLDRLASIVVKGQSSSGKSWAVQRTLRFFPESAFYEMTAASEHALIYDKEPLAHRLLVIYEASGLESEKFSYIVRSLLSEGQLRYPTVIKRDGELETVMIEREGPTNLVTTTTALRLHHESETRLLSLASDESPQQTSDVLEALAEEDDDPPDHERWHALQRWLELGERRVTIPYAEQLARLIPPVAVRLRRDFGSLLALIRSHALLHQASRERDGKGRIVATVDDYVVVRQLLADVISEAVERTVKPEVREIVEKVRELVDADFDGEVEVTQRQLVSELKLDKGSVSRRVRAALGGGYLVNREERRGRPHRLVPGDPLPDDIEILPEAEELHGCTVDSGGTSPPLPSPDGGQSQNDPVPSAEELGVEDMGDG
jgi:hypothetical protein